MVFYDYNIVLVGLNGILMEYDDNLGFYGV